jgi:hypothetical protein
MAGSGIERTSRPAPSGSPAGASELMPPHIQGAERRTGRRARWSLRALVIGGLTGAAWLLTGATAHTADRDAEPVATPSGSVVTHEPGGTTVDIAPPRPTDGPADLQQQPATVPVSAARIPGPSTADPVGEHPVVRRPGDERPVDALGVAGRPHGSAVTPVDVADRSIPLVRASSPRAHQAFRVGRAIKHGKHSRAAHRRPAVASATADVPVPDRRNTPGDDGPASPLRPYLGESGGSAATGPATPMEGGCAAFLPAAIADSTMACHRLPIATDVEARRHDAEAPTVSPD